MPSIRRASTLISSSSTIIKFSRIKKEYIRNILRLSNRPILFILYSKNCLVPLKVQLYQVESLKLKIYIRIVPIKSIEKRYSLIVTVRSAICLHLTSRLQVNYTLNFIISLFFPKLFAQLSAIKTKEINFWTSSLKTLTIRTYFNR